MCEYMLAWENGSISVDTHAHACKSTHLWKVCVWFVYQCECIRESSPPVHVEFVGMWPRLQSCKHALRAWLGVCMVRTVHPGGSMSEGPQVQASCAGMSTWPRACTHVHSVKRKSSSLRVRADRVTFSKGSAASDRAGLSVLAGRR